MALFDHCGREKREDSLMGNRKKEMNETGSKQDNRKD